MRSPKTKSFQFCDCKVNIEYCRLQKTSYYTIRLFARKYSIYQIVPLPKKKPDKRATCKNTFSLNRAQYKLSSLLIYLIVSDHPAGLLQKCLWLNPFLFILYFARKVGQKLTDKHILLYFPFFLCI